MPSKADRMERNARLWFWAGTVTLGVSLAYLMPIAGEQFRQFVGAAIEAFWNSPFGPF